MKTFKQYTEQEFQHEVNQFIPEFGEDICKEFLDYWSEGKPKMLFQYEKTWETHRRLARWQRNKLQWNKNKPSAPATTSGWVYDPKKDEW